MSNSDSRTIDRSRHDLEAVRCEQFTVRSIFTNNQFADACAGRTLDNVDPSTAKRIASFSRGGTEDVDLAVLSAHAAFHGEWSAISPQKRGEMLLALAADVEANADWLARLETLDVGKPLTASREDVAGAAATLRYNAGACDKLQGDTIPLGRDVIDFTLLEPLGVTAHVTPWNFPLGMAARSLAPALAAGCTAVIKPAEQSPLTTLALALLAAEAGFPAGVINVVTGTGTEAGAALIAHPLVDGIMFTGSVGTGRIVGAAAGQRLKPVVLELGGKNPMIVFDDADLGRAVDNAMLGAFDNCGQVCASVSRLLLQKGIRQEFLDRFIERIGSLKVGRGFDDKDLGPLVSAEHLTKVTGHIQAARSAGARAMTGGGKPDGLDNGYFVEPTVFDKVDPQCALAQEETFGPVVAVFDFETEAEAVSLANALPYGLVAGAETRDIDRALRMTRRLQAGSVWINGWFLGGVQAPTGGVKASGVGRERGLAGIDNYLSIKNVGLRVARAGLNDNESREDERP